MKYIKKKKKNAEKNVKRNCKKNTAQKYRMRVCQRSISIIQW